MKSLDTAGVAITSNETEARHMKTYVPTTLLPSQTDAPGPLPRMPFDTLPAISIATKDAIETAALEANDRYLKVFLEPHSFCPFSRGGRQKGHTLRLVHYADAIDLTQILDQLEELARDPGKIVIQLIWPLIDVAHDAWERFCHDLTDAANFRLRNSTGDDKDVFAVAPLHPALPYLTTNSYSVIPLFRRTPDPTIQWVRLDALQQLYTGRTSDAIYVDPSEILTFMAKPHREPLFDRIAETNMKMAKRLGIHEVERMLRDIARTAQDRYGRLLLEETPEDKPATDCPRHRMPIVEAHRGSECPRHHVPVSDGTPPRPAILERNGRWALVRVDELARGVGKRFFAADVELFAIRVGNDIHVLHGRCPHRHAPMTDAVLEEDRLVCPHHGWDFELATGRSQGVPGAAIAHFRTIIEDGLLWVDGSELDHWRRTNVVVFQAGDDIL